MIMILDKQKKTFKIFSQTFTVSWNERNFISIILTTRISMLMMMIYEKRNEKQAEWMIKMRRKKAITQQAFNIVKLKLNAAN
jgi:hypothetical protein